MVECPVPIGGAMPSAASSFVMQAPLADTSTLHSRPNATKLIYLDFNGHTTSGTSWKERSDFCHACIRH